MLMNRIRFVVVPDATVTLSLETLIAEMRFLDANEATETTLLIFPNHFADFEEYLDLVEIAEALASEQGYDGIYQIASIHPDYCFEDADKDDPANFTNRSIYPMLHLIRESSISEALENFPDAEAIPDINIAFARRKGFQHMQSLRDSCLKA